MIVTVVLNILTFRKPIHIHSFHCYLFAIAIVLVLFVQIKGVWCGKNPYRVLYSNDVTHIVSCVSPYHKKGEGFTEDMLKASILETADKGVDVHMLQPGLGWIPWWKSKLYPADEHYKAFMKRTGLQPDAFGQYMINGGDMVQVFVDVCKSSGMAPFISLRLNDGHHLENIGTNNPRVIWVSKFYRKHPKYRIGPNIRSWDEHVLNWAIPEVREHKLSFIKEICENYDIDGLELDFMRHSSYFQLDKTTASQRTQIMTRFVSRVRRLLNRTEKQGKHRWLCVRVPCHLAAHKRLGIDLVKFVAAGVDMVNLSPGFVTEQQTDLGKIRKLVPDVALYLELTHCISRRENVTGSGYDNFRFCRTTDEQFYTAAHLAYSRGADGVSTFNFVYYREHGTSGRGPFDEPPFHVLEHLNDPKWLAKQPHEYFLGNLSDVFQIPNDEAPKMTHVGEGRLFELDMTQPEEGWKGRGKLFIHGDEPFKKGNWKAIFNGHELKACNDISGPYSSLYVPCPDLKKHLLIWDVPTHVLRDGKNRVEVWRSCAKTPLFENFHRSFNKLDFLELTVN